MSIFGHFITYRKFFIKPSGGVLISSTLEGDLNTFLDTSMRLTCT